MPFFERPNARIRYEVMGTGSVGLTLINGYARPHTDFSSLARHFAGLGYSVLLLDNRGAGETVATQPFSLEDIADDVAALWDRLGWERSHVLGISFGGAVSVKLAVRNGDRLRSLALVSTPVKRSELKVEEQHAKLTAAELAADLGRYFSDDFKVKQKLFVQGFIRQMQRIFETQENAQGAVWQRAAIRKLDLTTDLFRIQCPTLVLHGSDDVVVPKSSAETMASDIPAAKLVLFPRAGHLLMVEAPKQVIQELQTFLGETDGKP